MSRVALATLAALCVSLGINLYLASLPKNIPIFFRESSQGQLTPIGRVAGDPTPDQNAIRSQLADWIANARSVTSDPLATKERQRRTATMVASDSAAAVYLAAYYKQNDPLALGLVKRTAIAVSYIALLPGSQHQYEAEWTEDNRDRSGQPISREVSQLARYHANLSVSLSQPTDEATIYANPLGIYITDLDWSRKVN